MNIGEAKAIDIIEAKAYKNIFVKADDMIGSDEQGKGIKSYSSLPLSTFCLRKLINEALRLLFFIQSMLIGMLRPTSNII